jgi:23S rRNA (uracil1939-C5)-methyltransferase
MIILQVTYDEMKWIELMLKTLTDAFPQITSANYIINGKRNDTFADLDVVCWKGNPYITEQMNKPDESGTLQFRVGPKSFYQTNSQQAYELYKVAWQMADLKGDELVYDLYTGTGTIANFVAGQAKKVVGLEYVAAAIDDAKVNSKINNITNTDFYAGDMKDLLNDNFLSQHGRPDTIITDPPRAGMHEDVTNMLLKAAPKRIVYVSCNAATQARDLKILSEKYDITAVQPVDMFPQTIHVENVVRLDLKK